MRKVLMITTAMMVASPVYAGNLAELGLDDPEVIAPECRILFGLLPCHKGFDYLEPEGNQVTDGPSVDGDNDGDDGDSDDHPDDSDDDCSDDTDEVSGGNPGNDKDVGQAGEQDKDVGESGGSGGASTGKE